ncbi:MAG: hypothetical protein ACREFQ_22450 [Stellaceae bacterium]
MSARRFRIEMGGEVRVGLLFRTEAELEEFLLLGRGGLALAAEPHRQAEAPDEPRRAGRPSKDPIIAAAVERLGPRLLKTELANRVRAVLRDIAAHFGPDEIPDARTVRRYLAGQNPGQNSGQNSDGPTTPPRRIACSTKSLRK